MNGESIDEKSVFNVARRIEQRDARETYLRRACGEDHELIARMQALLEAYEEQESFLESPASQVNAKKPTLHLPVSERLGDDIGPYKLLQQIGEGGMGVVYMAQQTEPIARRVALKIIKPGMDTRQVIARFEAERQALAMMDHPNIARALDAGMTETGRPYFVMELVRGVPITDYCDEHQLNPRERLELFVPVCHAVQHAHQKGIIHRDIKPSNVLVAHYDDHAAPKVIDFGVAKAVEHRLTEKTMFTEFGQVLGTVEYMSPEQARLNQWDVDTRSDIYSLGVLLYELLSGETPFDRARLRGAAFDELLRIIREEEAPRLSIRLSTSESLASISANRQIEPKQLCALLRGELDWIVIKALEKDRTRRYESASSFGEDVQHYLNNEPVEACPPSAAYRLHKFIGRNKPAIATICVIATTLLIGVCLATWQAIRATKARDRAVVAEVAAEQQAQRADEEAKRATEEANRALAEADKATAVVALLKDMLSVTDSGRNEGRDYTVQELLDKFSASLDDRSGELATQPEVELAIRQIIGTAYRELELTKKAEPHLARSLQLHRDVFGEQHVKYGDALRDLALNLWRTPWSDRNEVDKMYREALGVYQTCGEYERELRARFRLMLNYFGQSRLVEAERLAEETLELARQYNLGDSDEVTSIIHNLSSVKNSLGDNDTAQRLGQEAVDRCEKLHGDNPALAGWSWFNLGRAFRDADNLDEAEACFRKSLAHFSDFHPAYPPRYTGRAVVELIDILESRGEVSTLQELIDAYSPEILSESYNIAAHAELKWQRNPQRAKRMIRKSIELVPGGRTANGLAWWSATNSYSPFRESGEGIQIAKLAIETEPEAADYWTTLGVAQYRAGQIDESVVAMSTAIKLREGANGFNGFFLAMAHWRLDHAADALNWHNQAIGWMNENKSDDLELRRLRSEAAKMIGVEEKELSD